MHPDPDSSPTDCPYLETGDARCNHRFTLPRMDQALGVCMHGWRGCPVFQVLRQEKANRENQPYVVSLTLGRTEDPSAFTGRHRSLRPVGA